MNANSILNADMATLARWARQGFDWWVGELAALVPAGLRRRGTAGDVVVRFGADGRLGLDRARPPRRPVIAIDPGLVLVRRAILPAMSASALAATIRAEGERLVPLPAATVCIAGREIARDRTAGTIEVEVAALPLPRAEALAAALVAAQTVPARITIAAVAGGGVPDLDFVPLLRQRGLLPPASQARLLWWTLVGFLFLLNLFVLIWRDQAAVDALQLLVDEQRPTVDATQRVVRRIERFDRLAQQAALRRGAREPLAMLGHVSRLLPEGGFLLRFAWEGDALRLAGYKPRGLNIVQELRQSDRLGDIRNVRNDGLAEIEAGQPFEVSARVVRR